MTRWVGLALGLALAAGACDQTSGRGVDKSQRLSRARELSHRVTDALRCPADSWPIYAHDTRRSGASRGCCNGPLRTLWRFAPPPAPLRKARVFHAVASAEGVFASGVIGESPSVFGLSLDGRHLWTFDSHVDITLHQWPSFVLDRVILNDDGLYILDPRSGEKEVDRGLDSWGQVIADRSNLFATNVWYIAGPKTYVGALEVGGAPLWKHHEYGVVREDIMDRMGGLALSGDTLYFSPNYAPSPGAGIYAYSATGEPKWSVGTIPKSHLAIAGESLYAFERTEASVTDLLVSRNAQTGAIRWTTHASSPESTAPVVTSGLVISRDRGGNVVAVRRTDGTEAWKAALRAPDSADVGWATSVAAAAGSATLVGVDGRDLVVLSLADGQVRWRGRPTGLRGTIHSPVIAAGRVYVTDGDGLAALGCAED